MKTTKMMKLIKLVLIWNLALILITSCEPDDSDAVPSTLDRTAEIFIDGFSGGLDYQAFGDSKVTAFEVDGDITYENSDASMRFDVPNADDPESGYAGGIFFDEAGRNLTDYNVLTFWGRASQSAIIQELGFGLFETEMFKASITNVSFSTAWTQYYILLPDASRLTAEKGMFFFVDTPDDEKGYSFWIDDLRYESLDNFGDVAVTFRNGADETLAAFVGQVLSPGNIGISYNLPNGGIQDLIAANAYFDISSSSDAARIQINETTGAPEILVQSEGEAVIKAKLGATEASGSLTLQISEYDPAPTPDRPATDVISIFSDVYDNVPVDFYNGFYAPFQTTLSADFEVNGDNVLNYINYNFVGIEFNQNVSTIDASGMTHLHMDIYIPDTFDQASTLRINLVDFGVDQSFGGGDDTPIATVLNTSSSPSLVQRNWISVDFDITGLVNRSNLGQIVLDAETNESPRPSAFFVDNIYLYNDGMMTGGGGDPMPPSSAAPAPTQALEDVISLYSDTYQDVPNDGFNLYGAAAFEEVALDGGNALKYTQVQADGGNFQVIELGGNQVDAAAAGMTNFRFDAWFSNPVDASTTFLLKLVDIPGSGPTEALINVNEMSNPAIEQGTWLSFDIPFMELQNSGLGGTMNIQQVVIDLMNAGEIYLDNIYFYKGMSTGGGEAIPPTTPAPIPQQAAEDVISVYSDAYMSVMNDGLNLYGAAAFEEVTIDGISSLRYTQADVDGGNFQVIELGGNQVDAAAAGMTNFRFDAWFPNPLDEASTFLLKLVDIPASGPTEAQINVNSMSDPAISQGEWLSFDVPFEDLQATGLQGTMNIQQVVIDLMNIGDVYLDNIYFYKDPGMTGGEPMIIPPSEAAPMPMEAEDDVISIYSDAYMNVPNDGLNLYGAAAFEEVAIDGGMALKYTQVDVDGGNFQVIELGGNQIDASAAGMTNFRIDLWFSNELDMMSTFLLKLVDIPASGPTEAQITVNDMSDPSITQGMWLSLDIPFSDLENSGLAGAMNIQQVVIDLMNAGEVYIDNIYFYKDPGMGGGEPMVIPPSEAAPMPMEAADDVISIYSDAYMNVPNDGLNLYGAAAFEEVAVGGGMVLKYTQADVDGGNFQVIELGGNQIDAAAAGMTNFRFDAWFSNELDMASTFLLKLVDIPGSGPTEAQITINDMSDPSIEQGIWLSFDIPFADLQSSGLGGTMNIQQVVIDLMNAGEVYLDNIYFYKDASVGGGGVMPPNMAAPMPQQMAENVISIYSNAYENVPNDGFNLYGAAGFEEVDFDGDQSLKYTFSDVGGGNFQVIELGGNQVDAAAAGMTHFRFDLWFPNELDMSSTFLLKLVDIPGSGPTEAQINVNETSDPAIAQGSWLSFDIPFDALEGFGLQGTMNIQQVVIDLMNIGEVYIDNIYFYKE